jgi:serine/threonine protein phosphatase PrpC
MQILLGGPGKLDELGERLVATSLERGGTDNITAVLVRVVD